MQKLSQLSAPALRYVFCDIDDTLTTDGKLEAEAYQALWKLAKAGLRVIPVTGRPAGWCEMIARLWPVEAVIGENGAFYFSYDAQAKKMQRYFDQDPKTMQLNQQKIMALGEQAIAKFAGSAWASDQFCRKLDAAIDFCEDVADLGRETAKQIATFFIQHGASAKVSSIHVNAWFGDHDKLKMCQQYLQHQEQLGLDDLQEKLCFIGDSPNDESLFAAFRYSVGVANVSDFLSQLQFPPQYLCSQRSGAGFVEFAEQILASPPLSGSNP